jgi:hypothetical protein
MTITEALKFAFIGFNLTDESNGFSFHRLIAERKVFLSTKKLEYSGRVKIDETNKEVIFSDKLSETGSGLTFGTDSDIGPSIGFSTTTYNSGINGKSGTIEEQSTLFGKDYNFTFKFEDIRLKVTRVCVNEGYKFTYSIF